MEMDTGHIEGADLTVTLDYATAKAILVDGNPQAGMQAFMAGKIKVQGDMTKMMAHAVRHPGSRRPRRSPRRSRRSPPTERRSYVAACGLGVLRARAPCGAPSARRVDRTNRAHTTPTAATTAASEVGLAVGLHLADHVLRGRP